MYTQFYEFFFFLLQSGALLACGIVNCGVRNECDPALALLSDYVLHSSNVMRIGAIIGKLFNKFLSTPSHPNP